MSSSIKKIISDLIQIEEPSRYRPVRVRHSPGALKPVEWPGLNCKVSKRKEFVVTVRGGGKCPEAAKRPSRTLFKLGNQAGAGLRGSDTPLVP